MADEPRAQAVSGAIEQAFRELLAEASGALRQVLKKDVSVEGSSGEISPALTVTMAAGGAAQGALRLCLPQEGALALCAEATGVPTETLGDTERECISDIATALAEGIAAAAAAKAGSPVNVKVTDVSEGGGPAEGDLAVGFLVKVGETRVDALFCLSEEFAGSLGALALGAARGPSVRTASFEELSGSPHGQPVGNIDLLLDVSLPVTVELGRTKMLIRDLLRLVPGSVVELEKLASEPVDVLVNGRVVAKGEVVVIEDNFAVRVRSVVSAAERVNNLR